MVALRKAGPGDCADLCRIHRTSALTLGAGHYSPEELDAWVSHLRPERYEEPIATMEFLVAVEGNALVGFGMLNPNTAVLEAVYVAPERAGCGIGAILMSALEDIARTAGLTELRLDASYNALGFYERMGYAVERHGVHRTRAGRDVRCVHMRKVIAGESRTGCPPPRT